MRAVVVVLLSLATRQQHSALNGPTLVLHMRVERTAREEGTMRDSGASHWAVSARAGIVPTKACIRPSTTRQAFTEAQQRTTAPTFRRPVHVCTAVGRNLVTGNGFCRLESIDFRQGRPSLPAYTLVLPSPHARSFLTIGGLLTRHNTGTAQTQTSLPMALRQRGRRRFSSQRRQENKIK